MLNPLKFRVALAQVGEGQMDVEGIHGLQEDAIRELQKEAVDWPRLSKSRAWRPVLVEVAETAAKTATSPSEFERLASEGFDVVHSLAWALNPTLWDTDDDVAALRGWAHRDTSDFIQRKPGTFIYREAIETAIAEYLALPYRVHRLDRLLLDISMAQEIEAFFHEMERGRSTVKYSVWIWLISNVIQAIVGVAIAAGILWFSVANWALLTAAAIVLFVVISGVWSLISFLMAYPKHSRAKAQVAKLSEAMLDPYTALRGAPASTKHIEDRVRVATDAGVVWLAPMIVLLEDIHSRRATI
ncbi:hypothetical protein H4O09_09260 [Stenotrophomonas sp. W1S232]|uniref:Uncharacterized protein n=1 Tax=Stenotrophomonas koreensis TaxID=266128 RepID=A0A7W3V0G7_9GAMM|nr:hypothetical protein [Stenotrophomonas koreensis]MBB1117233.1 hypothetical protein [Stenotrophomonas koreensis]